MASCEMSFPELCAGLGSTLCMGAACIACTSAMHTKGAAGFLAGEPVVYHRAATLKHVPRGGCKKGVGRLRAKRGGWGEDCW